MSRNAVSEARRPSLVRAAAWLAGGTLALLCVSGGTGIAAQAGERASPPLETLMRLLAQRRHGKVRYVEQDYLAVLSRPLRSSGVLIYDAPDHLEQRTLKPRAQTLVLDHGKVTVRRGDRTYRFDLQSHPQVAPYVDAIRATMAGDLAALERVFEVRLEGSLAHWQLALVPLDRKIARGVQRIRIDGAGNDLESVEIDNPNGDRSVMTMGAPAGSPQP